jgi:hypothetical protein
MIYNPKVCKLHIIDETCKNMQVAEIMLQHDKVPLER